VGLSILLRLPSVEQEVESHVEVFIKSSRGSLRSQCPEEVPVGSTWTERCEQLVAGLKHHWKARK
jgi:hypothetical protein